MTNISLNNGGLGQGTASFGAADAGTQQNLTGLDALRAQPTFTFAGANGLSSQPGIPPQPKPEDDNDQIVVVGHRTISDMVGGMGGDGGINRALHNPNQYNPANNQPTPAADTDEYQIVVTGTPMTDAQRRSWGIAWARARNDILMLQAAGGIAAIRAGIVNPNNSYLTFLIGLGAGTVDEDQLTTLIADAYYRADGADGTYDGVSDEDRWAPYPHGR
jgi:hypothetical protein